MLCSLCFTKTARVSERSSGCYECTLRIKFLFVRKILCFQLHKRAALSFEEIKCCLSDSIPELTVCIYGLILIFFQAQEVLKNAFFSTNPLWISNSLIPSFNSVWWIPYFTPKFLFISLPRLRYYYRADPKCFSKLVEHPVCPRNYLDYVHPSFQ